MSYGQTRGHWAIALVLAAVVLTGGTAWAVDGQIDIYPTGATPYVISSPGSYVLVTDVNMTADVDCIQIAASNVTLDLNGHTLTGTGTGNSSGVMQTTGVGALVFNGSIYNFGRHGIFLNERSQVSDLSVLNCGDDGGLYYHAIRVGEGSIISRVTAANNYGNGIDAASNCLVESCVARNNGTVSHKGIAVGSGSTVKDCIAGNNGHRSSQDSSGTGIYSSGTGVTVTNNTCMGNSGYGASGTGYGINLGYGNLVMHNTCTNNSGTGNGSGYGIYVSGDSTLSFNTCTSNNGQGENSSGIGIRVHEGSTITNNTCTYNRGSYSSGSGSTGAGIVVTGAGNTISHNNCDANTGNGLQSSAGIRITGNGNRIENNSLTRHSGGIGSYGLSVSGTRNHLLSNTFQGNTTNSIYISGSNNYYAANIHPAAESISDGGTGNVNGTMPGSNVAVP